MRIFRDPIQDIQDRVKILSRVEEPKPKTPMDSKICWFEVIHNNHFVVKVSPLKDVLERKIYEHLTCASSLHT